MEIAKQRNNMAAQICARHLHLKSRINENIYVNKSDTFKSATMLYAAKVQVKLFNLWVTVWVETCDYSDGDSRRYIKNCAEDVRDMLTDKI